MAGISPNKSCASSPNPSLYNLRQSVAAQTDIDILTWLHQVSSSSRIVLSFKDCKMELPFLLVTLNVSCPPGLKDILHMVSSQWDQLQRQIRRQHSWMLRALRCIQARLLYTSQSHEPFKALGDSATNRQALSPADSLKVKNIFSLLLRSYVFCLWFAPQFRSIHFLLRWSLLSLSLHVTHTHTHIVKSDTHTVNFVVTFLLAPN